MSLIDEKQFNDLRKALDAERKRIKELEDGLRKITEIPNYPDGGDWDEIEKARGIANDLLNKKDGNVNQPKS